jgi:hypothetical protein
LSYVLEKYNFLGLRVLSIAKKKTNLIFIKSLFKDEVEYIETLLNLQQLGLIKAEEDCVIRTELGNNIIETMKETLEGL